MSKPTKLELLEEIDALDGRLDNTESAIHRLSGEADHTTAHLTKVYDHITELFKRIDDQDKTINALLAATTHKPYYIPTPAEPYKRWETTPGVTRIDCSTTVDL